MTYNEAARLRECLHSLDFCHEIVVVDLGSIDGSMEIAEELGARVIRHSHVKVVEEVRAEAASYAVNDWLVILDPDEVFPKNRVKEINTVIKSHEEVGIVGIPRRYYFREEPLYTTRWGIVDYAPRIVHRKRVRFEPNVHAGIKLREGFHKMDLDDRDDLGKIRHYWIDSIPQLVSKHLRYIRKEGEARYNRGERFGIKMWIRETRQALRKNLIEYNGIKGGLTGILLSLFYALYTFLSIYNLYIYQRRR